MNESIDQQVARLVDQIRSRRFRGEDPPVEVAPDASAAELVACVLAAERLNAPLRLGSGEYHPQEKVAEANLQGAMRALNGWAFREARRRLDEAARGARDPALQQRVTLYLGFCALAHDIVRTDPNRALSASRAEKLRETLPRLDCLSEAERAHYAAEIQRLCALREQVKSDPYTRALWCLVRARMALDLSEDDYGLTWLLAARVATKPLFVPGEYLQGLLERARLKVLLLLDEVPEAEQDTAREQAGNLRLGEVFDAFVAALDAHTGGSARLAMLQFGVRPFLEVTDEA